VFNLWGALLVWLATQTKNRRLALGLVCFGSFTLGLSILTKEPFLLTALPCFVFLGPKARHWRKNFDFISSAIVCFALPGLIFLLTLVSQGALNSWIEVLEYNIAYTSVGWEGRTTWLQKFIGNYTLAKFLFWRGSKVWVLMPFVGLIAGALGF